MCNVNDKVMCVWCEDEFERGEVFRERDLGLLCDDCLNVLVKRGEKLNVRI